jgi:aspartyl-tRNA(Asn)/glutamyl-tRNA(Gln) amidotransferase subunit B
MVDEVVNDNQPLVQEVLAGRERVFAFLVGQVMKKTKGSAPPERVNALLRDAIQRKKS